MAVMRKFSLLLIFRLVFLFLRRYLIKRITMEKEIIDLSIDTKCMLSYLATRQGLSLKSFIELELERIAEEEEDEILHELSMETEGELSEQEHEDFVKYLKTLKI